MTEKCISDAQARVLQRAQNIQKNSEDDDEYVYVPIENVQPRLATTGTLVESTMCLKNCGNNFIRFSLDSPIFDVDLATKDIAKVTACKNMDGGIDFVIYFKRKPTQCYKNNPYPSNPAYKNHI